MTKREQNLLTGLIAGLTVIGGGMVLHLFALSPYLDTRGELATTRETLAKKQEDLDLEKKKVETVVKRDPRLAVWQHTSLPGPSDDLLELETQLNAIKGVRIENITRTRPLGDPSAQAKIALTAKLEKEAKGQEGTALKEVLTKLRKDGWIKADLKFLEMPGPVAQIEGPIELKKTGVELKASARELTLNFPMIKRLPPRPAQAAPGGEATHLSRLRIEYEQYLSALLTRHGFAPETIKVRRRPLDRQSVPKLANKAPVYDRLAFTVSGRAPLPGIVKALDEFYRTELLHEISNMKIDVPQNKAVAKGALDVTLAVEAVLVDGADERTTLLPQGVKELVVLATPSRRYADLAKRNTFIGVPNPRTTTSAEEKDSFVSRVKEDLKEVLSFVRLTSLINNGRRWEGYLYNLGSGEAERRLNAMTVNEFTIRDKYRNIALTATVVLVDEVQLIFKSGGKFYRLRCGDFIGPALEKPLASAEVKEVGLAPAAAAEEEE